MILVTVTLCLLCLFTGTVDIPFQEICKALFGDESANPVWANIITELRMPMTVTALLTGAALSVSGLLLQTTFANPLAGPSVLGVSTGASLGVAIMLLAVPQFAFSTNTSAIIGATLGALAVIGILLAFSSLVKSAMMLLIVGIMVSYLASSVISILNFYATQEGVHSFVIWGLGNFSGVDRETLPLYACMTLIFIGSTFFMTKPLNAFLLGEKYASDIGTNIRLSRNLFLLLAGVLTAVTTAFCGPIGFLGLVVPHIARLLFRTSNHRLLVPGVIVIGALTGVLTLWISTIAGDKGMLPINAITSVIGVPVVMYIILNRRRISYFN